MSDRLALALAELVAALRDELASAAPDPSAPERLYSLAEAAAQLGIARSTLYGEIGAGRLRTLKIGRRRLVSASAISDLTSDGTPR